MCCPRASTQRLCNSRNHPRAVIVLFWIYASYKVNYWKRRGVEFLTPNLIFGNFKDAVLFRSAPGWHIGDLHKMARPDAPFVGFYIFHKPCLLLRDPDVIKHFMIRDFDNFSDRRILIGAGEVAIGEIVKVADHEQQARLVEDVETDEGRVRTGHLVQVTDVPSRCGTEEHGILEVAEDQLQFEAQRLLVILKVDICTIKSDIGMKNLFDLKNPAWKYLRTKITSTLTRGKLKQILPLMLETAEPMMKYIKDQSANHDSVKVLDAQHLNYKYTTDLIASIALGTKIDSFYYPNEFSVAVQPFFYRFKRMVALVTVFFMPELVEVIGTRMLFNSAFVRKIFWTAMENRERTGEKRGDFIDSLIQIKNGEQSPVYRMKLGKLHAKVVLALLLRDYEIWQTKEHTSSLDPRSTFTAAGNGINLHFKKI
ncbi:cytochrome P450 6k1-like [Temnothorax nylanderi]|uniref:cytochrome P450 6k1-like n=1 Tax=Temnothorax nylanderi TaxID=102681 RepID=UPI003A8C487B